MTEFLTSSQELLHDRSRKGVDQATMFAFDACSRLRLLEHTLCSADTFILVNKDFIYSPCTVFFCRLQKFFTQQTLCNAWEPVMIPHICYQRLLMIIFGGLLSSVHVVDCCTDYEDAWVFPACSSNNVTTVTSGQSITLQWSSALQDMVARYILMADPWNVDLWIAEDVLKSISTLLDVSSAGH